MEQRVGVQPGETIVPHYSTHLNPPGEPDSPFLLRLSADEGVEPQPATPAIAPRLPDSITNTDPSRVLDLLVAIPLLLFLLPLFALTALAVVVSGPGPIIYRQTRIGRNGQDFLCLKFRTMVDRADHHMDELLGQNAAIKEEWLALHKIRSDPRVTPIGRMLRRYCLDELPQLFNVLSGEMSIVGPRPIVAAEIEKYGDHFTDYCSVRPGLTGLWQVSGRHALSYEERVALDATYARSKCVRADLFILWRTVPIVLLGLNE
jgi:lipopolysaccharide/colanic/teichoic acid biosynthesis glycosyltransferase